MIFSKKCDIIPLGKSHKSLEMQKNLVQNSGTRWYFSCTVYIFSADDIFRKVAENPEKSTILANILRYLQIYIPAGPHWGGRGRTFKSCHSDQIKPMGRSPSALFILSGAQVGCARRARSSYAKRNGLRFVISDQIKPMGKSSSAF